ncbi:MAG TPA: hypothetical protein PLZ57_06180 [Pseudobdellovibrionaceae bacterium]|nr:hypothetical protein [Pseudobdellovibrionaceae bacterium]
MLQIGMHLFFALSLVWGFVTGGQSLAYAQTTNLTPNFSAKIFALKKRDQMLFTMKNEFSVTGDQKTYVSTYLSPEGRELVRETSTFQISEGREVLKKFRVEQLQLETDGFVELSEGKARFSFTKAGKTQTAEESVGEDFVVSSTLVAHLRQPKNWERLLKGERVRVRFAVIDRRETVGFEFFKVKEVEVQGRKAIAVKMKASSLIISAIVDPLHFYIDLENGLLLEMEGRSAVKVGEVGKWKDFDGYTVYTHTAK